MKRRASATTVTSASKAKKLEDRIRTRAYELFETRGRADGRNVDDWLQAEQEVTIRRSA